MTGAVRVCGHDVRTSPQLALRQLGVVFQSRALDGTLSVAQNFAYAGALYGISRRDCHQRGTKLLERVGLADRMNDTVRNLSGGQQRRVEIARALLHEPRLLLCDEATVGLDIKSRADIVGEVHALAAEQNVGVLWATHLIDEVSETDQVAILHQGKVLKTGSATEVSDGKALGDAFLDLTRVHAS